MSDVSKAQSLLEGSILKELLIQPHITDISFNGEAIYFQSSLHGRKKAPFTLTYDEAYQLIKQIANYMNVAFTFLDAIVDVSIAQYRIFAVGPAISRKDYQPSITFAIRIHAGHEQLVPLFLNAMSPWAKLFAFLISRGVSIVIAGKTGSGKTQLQKELLTLMATACRVIIIDNILELDGLMIDHLDLSIWQVKPTYSIQKLIEGALRSHPDWLLIAESRGEEFKEVLRSVKTGHPIITTLHSDAIHHIYDRMVSMLLINESISHAGSLQQEVRTFFPVLIHLQTHEVEEKLIRRIESVWIQRSHRIIELKTNISLKDIDEVIHQW